jgi:hypothetical protein
MHQSHIKKIELVNKKKGRFDLLTPMKLDQSSPFIFPGELGRPGPFDKSTYLMRP